MSDQPPIAISDITDPDQVRAVLYASRRFVHAPLSAVGTALKAYFDTIYQPRSAPITKTANFTVAATENNLINNKPLATCTVTLPAASSFPGREILIKNLQAFTVVSASSDVVPLGTATAGTAILAATAGKWAKLVSDGTNWVVMAAA